MAIEYNFTLDMDRSKRDNNIAYARTGDVDSITINADLVLNGTAYTPTGTNAFFECITPNGHSIRAAAEKTGSTVSVDVPSAAFQAAGVINVAYFRFESGEADNPTYVESTEPFAIIVREGIGDDVDAGDYIEEWRQLADSLDEMVKEVQQKATQAEAAIDASKEEVVNAAEDVTAAGDQAISQFETNSQQAINSFNTNGTSAINQFNTNANGKLDEVDGMITEAQGDVDAAITQLESETQNAIKAAQDALDGTTAANLQNAINRTLKLDITDMTNIPDNASLSSFVNVGSYCCKTASTAATIGDCPIDNSPFNMYVFSSAASGQVMQLVVPIDLQGKPTAEWHVRFGTSSAMDNWSVIGGMPDIVPVSQGGTGVTTAEEERDRLGLGNTTEAVPIANGGTGATDAANARQQLQAASNSYTNSSTVSDTDYVITSTSASSGTRATLATLWNWIVTKIRSVFGFDSSNVLDVEHGGTGFNDLPAMLVNLGSTSTASPYQSAPRPGVTGTLPVSRGGTGATSISALRRSLKLYSGSKVVMNNDAFTVLFTNSEYAGITGRGFNQTTDCIVVMNADADATQTEFYCTSWKASTGNIGVFCGAAGARRVNYFIIAP